jgi:hypothetical protein
MSALDIVYLVLVVVAIVGVVVFVILGSRELVLRHREDKLHIAAMRERGQKLKQEAEETSKLHAQTAVLLRETDSLVAFLLTYQELKDAVRQGAMDRYDAGAAMETAISEVLQSHAPNSPRRAQLEATIRNIRSVDDYGL